jgi:hypothetical protein
METSSPVNPCIPVPSVVKIFQESRVRTNFTGDLKKAAQLAHREKRLKRGRHELEQKLIR